MSTAASKIKDLQAEAVKAGEDLSASRSEIATLRNEADTYKTDISKARQENLNLQAQHQEELTAMSQWLHQSEIQQREAAAAAQAQNSDLNLALQKLTAEKDELAKEQQASESRHDVAAGEAQDQILGLRRDLEHAQSTGAAYTLRMQTINRDLEAQLKSILHDKDDLGREKDDLDVKLKELSRRKGNTDRELVQANQKMDELQKASRDMEADLVRFRALTPPSTAANAWSKTLHDFNHYMCQQDIEIEGELRPEVLLWELSTLGSSLAQQSRFDRFKDRASREDDSGYYCVQQVLNDDKPNSVRNNQACADHLEDNEPCIQIRRSMTRDAKIRLIFRQILEK